MKNLIIIEFLKFRKNPVTIVIFILFTLLFSIGILYIGDAFKGAPPPFPSPKVFTEFPTIWDYQGYIGNWLVSLLLGFMMINFITTEEVNKTMRQSIINGFTRKDYWMGKLLLLLIVSTYATMIYAISTIVIGWLKTPDVDVELLFDNNYGIFRFFLMSVGYLSMASFFGFWIKRGLLSLFAYLAYIMAIETIIRGIHLYYYKDRSVLFYPANIIEDLMPNPFLIAPDTFMSRDVGFKVILSNVEAVGLSSLLIAIFLFITYRLITKKDL
jgi:ABC-2 type transport system permease protein